MTVEPIKGIPQEARLIGVVGNEVTKTATVASGGGSETVDIKPPAGEIWDIVQLFFKALAPGGTAGNHELWVKTLRKGTVLIEHLFGKSAYDTQLLYADGYWRTANTASRPTTEVGQMKQMSIPIATNDQPVRFKYQNDADSDQTNDRTYRYNYKKYRIIPSG